MESWRRMEALRISRIAYLDAMQLWRSAPVVSLSREELWPTSSYSVCRRDPCLQVDQTDLLYQVTSFLQVDFLSFHLVQISPVTSTSRPRI
jgi:hypothetical protein